MPSPLVSVIVPNYNYARFLEERIESILMQSFQDFGAGAGAGAWPLRMDRGE